MASRLPSNILSYIATHVPKESQLTCALVCKQWKEPFLDVYWGTLKIGPTRIKTMVDTPGLEAIYQNNRHRVWALQLYNLKKDDIKYLLGFHSYPMIKYLLYHEPYGESTCMRSINWTLWNSLSHLDIKLNIEYSQDDLSVLFKKLSVLKNLVHLTLKPSNEDKNQTSISWVNFESLYDCLPHLEYLETSFPLGFISIDELENIRSVQPSHTMSKISCVDAYIDTLWILYFATKYPNLRRFTVVPDVNYKAVKQVDYSLRYENELEILSTLDQFFPCLKRADTPLVSYNEWPFSIFYETLCHFGVQLDHVKFESYAYSPTIIKDISRCIQPVSESLKVMCIEIFDYPCYQDTISLFSTFPRLVELHINASKYLVNVSRVLDQCPVLRLLDIHESIVEFDRDQKHAYTPHPLQRLELEHVSTVPDTFTYLSLRCKTLLFIKISNVQIIDFDWQETGKVVMDMGVSRLETLIISNIMLDSDTINYYAIEQMESTDTSPASQSIQDQPSKVKWYHVCMDKTNKRKRLLAWELGGRDIEFAQRYYSDFKRRKIREKGRSDMVRCNGYSLKRFWKRDLQKGILIFRIKSTLQNT
ncbi:hypothetical protein CLU79DRAFT_722236 [Phycomyces nitens]|nr:hypothetical protein CLU79DRAFT_722236 [Phycomyces nitens]